MSIFFKFFRYFLANFEKKFANFPLISPQKRVKKQEKIREFLRKNAEFLIKKRLFFLEFFFSRTNVQPHLLCLKLPPDCPR